MKVVRFFFICIALICAPTSSFGANFDDLLNDTPATTPSQMDQLHGAVWSEAAYTFADPKHWSKGRVGVELSDRGKFSDQTTWKVCMRGYADGVFAGSDHYPDRVRNDERNDLTLCEAYVDTEVGSWTARLGNQYIVWGEMVGIFVGDVVSPRDLRDGSVRADLTRLRLPQWAARLENDFGDVHADLVFIPKSTVDKIGKRGSEFSPYNTIPGTYLSEEKNNGMNLGARLGYLVEGWDLSGFVYRSTSVSPVFERVSEAGKPPVFRATHDRITQIGGTVTKDMDHFVLKGEIVATDGRRIPLADPTHHEGLQKSPILDYAIGADIPLSNEGRFNMQFIQSVVIDHTPSMLQRKTESAASALLSLKPTAKLETQLLVVYGLDRGDYLVNPQATYNFTGGLKGVIGAEVYGGSEKGYFGRFDHHDRATAELKYSF